jgi:hypothetical protein
MTEHHRRTAVRRHLTAVAAYVLVAVAFTWPLLPNLATHLTGPPDGDTGVYVWNQWVFQHELLEHRTLPYFTDRIFKATGRANLSLHNYTAFANILALPLERTLGVVATFNLVYLALTVLTAYAVFLLVRRLTDGDTVIAWLAGVLFAWSPALVTRGMGHFSMAAAAPLPIFVLLLIRIHEHPARREAILLGVTVAWATACDVYYGVYCVMMALAYLLATSFRITRSGTSQSLTNQRVLLRSVDLLILSLAGLVLALLVSNGWQFSFLGRVVRVRTIYTPALVLTALLGLRMLLQFRPKVRAISLEEIGATVRILATAALVSAILMSPLLYAVGVRALDDQIERSTIFWRSSPPGTDALALIAPNPNHPFAPAALREWITGLSRDGYLENVASIPFIALAVILVAWWTGWRPPNAPLALTIGSLLLALGPFLRIDGVDTHIPAPWAILRYIPIIRLTRSPARFFIVAMLGIAILFAVALRALASHPRAARRPVLAGAALLMFVELWPAPRTLFPAAIPTIYSIIANDPRTDASVLELPFGVRDGTMSVGNFTSRTQFYQTAHARPIIGGYLSRVSRRRVRDNETDPVLGALIRLSEGQTFTPDEMERLRMAWPEFVERVSIGYVVLDRDRAPDSLRFAVVHALQLEEVADEPPLMLYRPVLHVQ